MRPAWRCCFSAARPHRAQDTIYFSATDNVTNVLVQKINAETVRLDISSWYLSEHAISIAIANRFAAGVKVRIIGDRGAIFETDPHTKTEFYWLANQGVPIRLRFNPTWFPEINHWKMALFVGQNLVEFGSGNFAPTELAPVSATNYSDETELFTTDPAIVNAFKTKFDVMWNDTTRRAAEHHRVAAVSEGLVRRVRQRAHRELQGFRDAVSEPRADDRQHRPARRRQPDHRRISSGARAATSTTGSSRKSTTRTAASISSSYRLEVDNITKRCSPSSRRASRCGSSSTRCSTPTSL